MSSLNKCVISRHVVLNELIFCKDIHNNYASSTSKGNGIEMEVDATPPSYDVDLEE